MQAPETTKDNIAGVSPYYLDYNTDNWLISFGKPYPQP